MIGHKIGSPNLVVHASNAFVHGLTVLRACSERPRCTPTRSAGDTSHDIDVGRAKRADTPSSALISAKRASLIMRMRERAWPVRRSATA
jgi:hypothetical protein